MTDFESIDELVERAETIPREVYDRRIQRDVAFNRITAPLGFGQHGVDLVFQSGRVRTFRAGLVIWEAVELRNRLSWHCAFRHDKGAVMQVREIRVTGGPNKWR